MRAICGASYKKENHQLSFAILKSSSDVKYAYCTSRAGKGGWCNNIYGLMKVMAKFSLENSKCIPELLPCTSRPCGWTVPRKRQQNVTKPSAMDTTVRKIKPDSKGISCNLFDARAEHLKQLDFNSIRQCQTKLAKVNHMIPFVNSVREETDVHSSDFVNTKYGKLSLFSTLAKQCPMYGESFKVYCSIDPGTSQRGSLTDVYSDYPSFPHSSVPVYYDISQHQLRDEELLIYDDLDLTLADSVSLEKDTREQANSSIWKEHRKHTVTASRIYDVYSWKRGMEKHAENFVAEPSTPSAFLQRRFDHGHMYEPIAWKKYHEYFASVEENIKVLSCGLVVNVNNPWLGCSPDSKMMFSDMVGIGESKCPYEQRDSDLMDVAKADRNFYLEAVGNSLHLKHEHPVGCSISIGINWSCFQ